MRRMGGIESWTCIFTCYVTILVTLVLLVTKYLSSQGVDMHIVSSRSHQIPAFFGNEHFDYPARDVARQVAKRQCDSEQLPFDVGSVEFGIKIFAQEGISAQGSKVVIPQHRSREMGMRGN